MIRKYGWLAVLALAGTGCISPMAPFKEEMHKDKAPEVQPLPPMSQPPRTVMPDDVTEANASEKAQALAEEMDYDETQRSMAPPLHPEYESARKP